MFTCTMLDMDMDIGKQKDEWKKNEICTFWMKYKRYAR